MFCKQNSLFFLLALITLFFSCGKDGETGPEGPQGPDGLKSILDVKPVVSGENCVNGGLVILSGIDKNGNNALDANEVENTQYICNGSNATTDKQVIIRLGNFDSPIDQQAQVGYYLGMPRFNINNYPGVDSMILIGSPYNNYGSAAGSIATLELINYADKTVIENTGISSDAGWLSDYKHGVSENFYSSFPKHEFDLGFKLKASLPGSIPRVYGDVVLILYRK